MSVQSEASLDQLSIDTVRMLALDAVQQAESGHPGLPLGAAPMAYVLWARFLRHNPANPRWTNRDRFLLSAGHGSMLLYALLHLTGYDLPLAELKRFRQWGSRTPGHPENVLTPGVEITTGPLGQGFANGVGMAMGAAHLAARFNREGFPLIDHFVYAIVSDGDLMEGVAAEAASLAGTLKLGKLIYLYDDNHVTIEGDTALAFREDVLQRFAAYGWHTQRVDDGNDLDGIDAAIRRAQEEEERPSLIAIRTVIGYGMPSAGTAKAHSDAPGVEAIAATRRALGLPDSPPFHVPPAVLANFRQALEQGRQREDDWNALAASYAEAHAEDGAAWRVVQDRALPPDWETKLPDFGSAPAMATRAASGLVLNALASVLPQLFGGSADLAPSTKTDIPGGGSFGPENHAGRVLHFGVREHAMGACLTGIALNGGLIPFGATFLIFSDYMKPAIRLAALSEAQVIYVFTHDSVGLGEDGPTHQPIEQLAGLRAIPNLLVIRPADAHEVREAWRVAIARRHGPTALVLSRQEVPTLDRRQYAPATGLSQGGYVLAEAAGPPALVLIATGSEVALALAARERLQADGVPTRVVSLPCWSLFDGQPEAYRHDVLPPGGPPRLAIEAGSTLGWARYIGDRGDVIGIDRFGASAPGSEALERLGLAPGHVVERARTLLGRSKGV